MFKRILLWYYRSIKGPLYYARKIGVTVGKDCRIFSTSFGSEPFLITIGDHVTITSGVHFITHDGSAWLMRDEKGRRHIYSPIYVGNYVFIGLNSIIMPGVRIEDRVIIAAGSVVTKSIPSGVVVAGVPAKIIGEFDSIEQRMLNDYIKECEMDLSLPYKERVSKVINNSIKPYLKKFL